MITNATIPSPSPTPIVGLFGGSFDPVHNGHLGIAEQLVNQGVLDEVVFMPAATAPHKPNKAQSSADDRLAMLEIATRGHTEFRVSDYEISRGGISYTIDTVHHFNAIYGDGLRLVIGMDSLDDLHKWYKSQELIELCPIVIYHRPGIQKTSQAVLTEQFGEGNAQRLISGIIEAETFDVSSTRIRDSLKSGKFPERLIPEDVYCYIKRNRLYV